MLQRLTPVKTAFSEARNSQARNAIQDAIERQRPLVGQLGEGIAQRGFVKAFFRLEGLMGTGIRLPIEIIPLARLTADEWDKTDANARKEAGIPSLFQDPTKEEFHFFGCRGNSGMRQILETAEARSFHLRRLRLFSDFHEKRIGAKELVRKLGEIGIHITNVEMNGPYVVYKENAGMLSERIHSPSYQVQRMLGMIHEELSALTRRLAVGFNEEIYAIAQ